MMEARNLTEARTPDEIEHWLLDRLAALLAVPRSTLGAETPLADLGLDSLELEGLLSELEQWLEARVDAGVLLHASTLRDVIDGVSSAPRRHASAIRALEPDGAFSRLVNPALGARLQRLRLDKRFVRGQGCRLYDDEGRQYLDFVAAYGALPFGHHPPQLRSAVQRYFESQEPSFVQPSALVAASELAAELLRLAPSGLSQVTFANSGAEAVEAAFKLCRAATGRAAILACTGSFHGKTAGALAATGNEEYRRGYLPTHTEVDFVPFGDLDQLHDALLEGAGRYAAFVVEAIQGEGGVVVPPSDYLIRAQAFCRKAGTLFVVDEVQTGLGRTGRLFACEHEDLEPDVLILAKALGGGLLPIGACLSGKSAASERFGLTHSSTFAGGSLACRVALASLELLQQNDAELVHHVAETGLYLKAELERLQQRFPRLVLDVRGRGFLLGLRLTNTPWCERSLLGVAAEQGMLSALLASYLLNCHAVRVAPTLNHSNVVRIEPPLIATRADCDELLAALEQGLEVFEQADAAAIFDAIEGATPARRSETTSTRPRPSGAALPLRFGFIGHPLDRQALVDFDPSLTRAAADSLGRLESLLAAEAEPFVASSAQIKSKTGEAVQGDFIAVPRTAAALLALPETDAVASIQVAVDLAVQRGARVIGLGGYTSVVTRNGLALRVPDGVSLTTGNSYTAAAGFEGLSAALSERKPRSSGAWDCLAIVGAAGSIGQAVAILASERFASLVLLGNPTLGCERGLSKLERAAQLLCRSAATRRRQHASAEGSLAERLAELELEHGADFPRLVAALTAEGRLVLDGALAGGATKACDAIVTATSAPLPLLLPEHLGEGAVVCDLSRPSNVHPSVAFLRPDVVLLEAGLVDVPNGIDLRMFGLPSGRVYACMAETILLALDGVDRHFGLGARLRVEDIEHLSRLSQAHGLQVSTHTNARETARALRSEEAS